jgi:branched-chain amino acid transport system substrate-binding protein
MKRRLFTLVLSVAVIASLVIVGCAEPAPAPSPGPAPAPSPAPSPAPAPSGPKEILVGCVSPVTGMYAGMADGGVPGMEFAIEDINALGGVYVKEYDRRIPLKLIVVDSESDPNKAGTLAEALGLEDKVHFFSNHNEPPQMCAPIATAAARLGIPYLGNVAVLEPWLEMRSAISPAWTNTWAMGFAIGTPAAPSTIWDKPGYTVIDNWKVEIEQFGDQTSKKAGMLCSDDPEASSWYTLFPQLLAGMGVEVVGVDKKLGLFPTGTMDFTSIIEEWKRNDVEILWGNCPAPDFGAFLKQARALGFEPKIVSNDRAGLYYTDVIAWGGGLAHGLGLNAYWSPESKVYEAIGDTTPMSLYERWQEKKKLPLNIAMPLGYQAIQVLADSIERAGTLDGDAVLEAIAETDMMTIHGRIKFDQETQFARFATAFGQWQEPDKAGKYEYEFRTVFSYHDFMPVTGEFIFPIPYD